MSMASKALKTEETNEGRTVAGIVNSIETRLKSGDVQWMTAGAGVVHAEMPSAEFMRTGGGCTDSSSG